MSGLYSMTKDSCLCCLSLDLILIELNAPTIGLWFVKTVVGIPSTRCLDSCKDGQQLPVKCAVSFLVSESLRDNRHKSLEIPYLVWLKLSPIVVPLASAVMIALHCQFEFWRFNKN